MTNLIPVNIEHIYRLFNVGGTSLVSAFYNDEADIMPATWVCPLSISPARVTACIDHTHFTRSLIDNSRIFALALPTISIAQEVFKTLDEPHIAKTYDLFIGEAVAAWADPRIFDGRHWLFEKAPKELSTLHYVAGGHFYGIGQVIDIAGYDHLV